MRLWIRLSVSLFSITQPDPSHKKQKVFACYHKKDASYEIVLIDNHRLCIL